jgi:hypothetical protein
LLSLVLLGCSSDPPAPPPEPPCVQGLSAQCQPEYDPPIYATLHAKIFLPICAAGTGTCHSADGAKNGLIFENADQAYGMLLGQNGAHVRVIPGDPSCSLIMKRLTSKDPNYHMPPGSTPLTAGEICAITQWIANGAKR